MTGSLKDPPLSVSALKTEYHTELRVQATQTLQKSPRYGRIRTIDPTLPSNNFRKLVRGLSRKQMAIITQLRTGHVPLNHHLHRINRAESAACPGCGYARETVLHFLTQCPAWETARTPLVKKLWRKAYDLRTILNTREAIPALLRFITDTGRLEPTFGDLRIKDVKSFLCGTGLGARSAQKR